MRGGNGDTGLALSLTPSLQRRCVTLHHQRKAWGLQTVARFAEFPQTD